MKPMKPNSIRYETETCSRCGGSGHYSYNQRTGTTCFKCLGAGLQRTKRGARARTAVENYKDAIARKVARIDLVPGDWLLIRGGGGRLLARKVESIDSSVFSWKTDGGTKQTRVDIRIVTTRPVESGFGPCRSFGGDATTIERLAFNADEKIAILDYASTFKGATVTDADGVARILR